MHDKFYNGPMSLDRIAVVLARASHPGNVGSAARAMKTMGFTDLRLVDPPAITDEARALAAGAVDVLDGAASFASLGAGLADCVLAVGFTTRARDLSHESASVRELAPRLLEESAHGTVALVFGNETSGLSNEELGCCQRIATIPANPAYPSLNLAAAVQVACYEIATAAGCFEPSVRGGDEPATVADVEALHAHFERVILASGHLDPAHPGRLLERLRRLFARARLERSEVKLLRGVLESFEKKMRR
jgi:tRNA/rRNA methyltransferase